jgi:hypothetical protein
MTRVRLGRPLGLTDYYGMDRCILDQTYFIPLWPADVHRQIASCPECSWPISSAVRQSPSTALSRLCADACGRMPGLLSEEHSPLMPLNRRYSRARETRRACSTYWINAALTTFRSFRRGVSVSCISSVKSSSTSMTAGDCLSIMSIISLKLCTMRQAMRASFSLRTQPARSFLRISFLSMTYRQRQRVLSVPDAVAPHRLATRHHA